MEQERFALVEEKCVTAEDAAEKLKAQLDQVQDKYDTTEIALREERERAAASDEMYVAAEEALEELRAKLALAEEKGTALGLENASMEEKRVKVEAAILSHLRLRTNPALLSKR